MTNKEILLNWINVTLSSSIHINQDNLLAYIGDIEEPIVQLIEYKIRKELLECYLEKPCEETIDAFLHDIQADWIYNGRPGMVKRAINKVLIRFNKPVL